MTKREISDAGINGLPLQGRDVATQRGRVIRVRHRWTDADDGRALHTVHQAWLKLAQQTANKLGKSIEVYNYDGAMLDQIEPTDKPEA